MPRKENLQKKSCEASWRHEKSAKHLFIYLKSSSVKEPPVQSSENDIRKTSIVLTSTSTDFSGIEIYFLKILFFDKHIEDEENVSIISRGSIVKEITTKSNYCYP